MSVWAEQSRFLASGFGSLAFSTLGGGGGGFLISGGVSTFWIGLGCSWRGTSTRLMGRKSCGAS